MPRPPLRWILPLANVALDLPLVLTVLLRSHWTTQAVQMLVAANVPVGLLTYAPLSQAPAHWIWFHEGLSLFVWFAFGRWLDDGRPGARRVCGIYFVQRTISVALVLAAAWAGGAAVVAGYASALLGLVWISATAALLRDVISRILSRQKV